MRRGTEPATNRREEPPGAPGPLTRRDLLRRAVVASGGLAAAACAPAAPAGAPSGLGSGGAAWEAEWDRLQAAARKEGSLVANSGVGAGYREAFDEFERAFPGIKVEVQSFSSLSLFTPRIRQEREAGIFAWDIGQAPAVASLFATLKPIGALEPLRPAIFRPDVLDDSAWTDGYAAGWMDLDKTYGYAFGVKADKWWINTDLVREDEVRTLNDLLNPKWAGKIIMTDISSGGTWGFADVGRLNVGDEPIRRLFVDQKPRFDRDPRRIAEAMARGEFPIANGVLPAFLQEYQAAGLGKNVKAVEIPELRYYIAGGGLVMYSRAPHPNAARLFANWVLTREGQTIWRKTLQGNSRRTDVEPADPVLTPYSPGQRYIQSQLEEYGQHQEDTRRLLAEWVKA